jgi:hypothetical protein
MKAINMARMSILERILPAFDSVPENCLLLQKMLHTSTADHRFIQIKIQISSMPA